MLNHTIKRILKHIQSTNILLKTTNYQLIWSMLKIIREEEEEENLNNMIRELNQFNMIMLHNFLKL